MPLGERAPSRGADRLEKTDRSFDKEECMRFKGLENIEMGNSSILDVTW